MGTLTMRNLISRLCDTVNRHELPEYPRDHPVVVPLDAIVLIPLSGTLTHIDIDIGLAVEKRRPGAVDEAPPDELTVNAPVGSLLRGGDAPKVTPEAYVASNWLGETSAAVVAPELSLSGYAASRPVTAVMPGTPRAESDALLVPPVAVAVTVTV